MLRFRSAVTILLLSVFLLGMTAPAFAENPWADEPGKKGANHTPSGDPWIEGPPRNGYGKGGQLPGMDPWAEGRGKGGANHNASAIAFIEYCWRLFRR